MLVLAVDTSTPAVTAGLVDCTGADGRSQTTLAVRTTVDPRLHAEVLTPHVLECFEEVGCSAADLDAVVVGTGPGPFTGLRVGMATAAAFADAVGVAVHGVGSLDAIAADVAHPGTLLVITDARRREVYWARFERGARVAGPAVCAPGDVAIADCDAVAGSPIHAALYGLPVVPVPAPTPSGLVSVAASALIEGRAPAPLVPQYLRRPDALTLADRAR